MLNLDTHIIALLLAGKLNQQERSLVASESVAISDIVLWELAMLRAAGRIEMDFKSAPFRQLLRELTIFPITMGIAETSTPLDFSADPADEIIAATSVVERIPLLTRDRRILKSRMVPFAL